MAIAVLLTISAALAYRAAERHPVIAGITAATALVAVTSAMRLRAWIRDRSARRRDPRGPGVVIGHVRGDWRGARPRPFVIPWRAFHQHVLIDGPTGRGKTFTFIEPFLHAHLQRQDAGVFYLDGKGDPIHEGDMTANRPPMPFDHVFWPEHPERSAYWNPLAGRDPIEAANLFAAALFPEAVSTEAPAAFYASRAVYAITRVAPAMAFTGYGVGNAHGQRVRGLRAMGIDDVDAARLARDYADRIDDHLAWLPYRADPSLEGLIQALERDLARPDGARDAARRAYEITPADLSRTLFEDGELASLANALTARVDGNTGDDRDTLRQLAHEVHGLAELPAREAASVFQTLQNRVSAFLQPPFSTLCARSDFTMTDVAAGARIAFLLPTGRFPNLAKTLGRAALSQFKNAVLASSPGRPKIAVLDEFHNFVTGDFAAFLNQARSRGGAAVMAMQSLGDFPPDALHPMLANISTLIVTPGCKPADADYWADVFGKQVRKRRSTSYELPAGFAATRRRTVRVDQVEEHRYSPTAIAELPSGAALIKVTDGRTAYEVAEVDIERRS